MSEAKTLIVVGGGIAGLVAAREAAAAGALVTHIMGSDVMGGLVANVGALDDFSGGAVAGIDLATTLFSDASELGVLPVLEDATAIGRNGARFFVESDDRYEAGAVIVATGARLRPLDVPGAERLTDRGVSYCGWCDGALHKGKSVVVLGGGDAAAQEALHLASIAERVTLLVRGPALKARAAYVERLTTTRNITVLTSSEAVAVLGTESVEGVRVRSGGAEYEIACSGVFPFLGLLPATGIAPAALPRDAQGALITDQRLETPLHGLFAVGAVRAGFPGGLDDAIEDARRAADFAIRPMD